MASKADIAPPHLGSRPPSRRAQTGTCHVANIEDEAAEHDEKCEHMTQARQDPVADFLRPQAGHADDPPYVQLQSDVDHDRDQDRKRKRSAEFRGELRRLRDEARADGAGGHQEHRAE